MARYPYFPESALAHQYLDPLQPGPGLEIGGAAHNDFFIPNTLNVDWTADMGTVLKRGEIDFCGRAMPVDLVGDACCVPVPDSSQSWLIHSHVFEHLTNPVLALHEWYRVLRDGAILFSVVCRRDTLEQDRIVPVTSLAHLLEDYERGATWETHDFIPGHNVYGHCHVFTMSSYLGLIAHFDPDELKLRLIHVLEHDDKVGNGFTTVHRVVKGC
jgi:SAM-dependent methyltransferase